MKLSLKALTNLYYMPSVLVTDGFFIPHSLFFYLFACSSFIFAAPSKLSIQPVP